MLHVDKFKIDEQFTNNYVFFRQQKLFSLFYDLLANENALNFSNHVLKMHTFI